MLRLRKGRRRYYDAFSHCYDAFIRLHSRGEKDDTRRFLVESAHINDRPAPRILDICCGTGAVVLAFAECRREALAIGYDFSHGMLRKAQAKDHSGRVAFVEGDAAALPFVDACFDVVNCSHALYELKGDSRLRALEEMQRVVRPDGIVLILEHEVPRSPITRLLFRIRMLAMGAQDSREFVEGRLEPFERVFSHVSLSHSRSGRSRLVSCRK